MKVVKSKETVFSKFYIFSVIIFYLTLYEYFRNTISAKYLNYKTNNVLGLGFYYLILIYPIPSCALT